MARKNGWTMDKADAKRILELLDDPSALEELYRESPGTFRIALTEALELRPDSIVLRVWAARMSGRQRSEWTGRTLGPAIAIAVVCGLLVRLPAIWLSEDWYYPRFAPFCVILSLVVYFWLGRRDRSLLIGGLALALLTGVFVSFLPGLTDSVLMALIHLPILWWAFLGIVFTAPSWRDTGSRIRFLRYNGELLIIGSLVALGGIVFSGITVALFELVKEGIDEWYAGNMGVAGAAAVPVAATYLYDKVFRRRTGIASVLARVFAPLFLVMACTYLVVAFAGGQNPFMNRNSLIIVNGLLVVVLGMTVLSVAERDEGRAVGWVDHVNLALLAVTLLIDVVALSAILFRLTSYGLTPNRVVVLGVNVVILAHLVLACRAHIRFVRGRDGIAGLHGAACGYLPVYALWAALVTFVLPLVFRFS